MPLDFELAPLKDCIRPRGPLARTTLYRMGAEHPGLLRRIGGLRDTYVHLPTLRSVLATAEPVMPVSNKKAV